ncbi:class F sortase [Pseudonocardia spirodelae]|uniref:Class F sortase n=1 Tax=Pseudonocardia spirodelae TaxID=3133431 RepID=A0ABU8T2W7_9PSEU
MFLDPLDRPPGYRAAVRRDRRDRRRAALRASRARLAADPRPLYPTLRAVAVSAVLLVPVVTTAALDPGDPPAETASAGLPPVPAAFRAAPAAPAGARGARPVAPPTGLSIPSIGLTVGEPEPLALDADGVLPAPADFARTGWWTGGPKPGEAGPAVIVGHVDSWRGPAVFFRLRDVPVGATVVVPRSDGRSTTFTVDAVRTYPKDRFPSDEVYGATANAQLRLITCGGAFDHAARSYDDNVVVFASVH